MLCFQFSPYGTTVEREGLRDPKKGGMLPTSDVFALAKDVILLTESKSFRHKQSNDLPDDIWYKRVYLIFASIVFQKYLNRRR